MTPDTEVVTEIADAATVTPAMDDATNCRECGAALGWRDAFYDARGTGQCKRCKQRGERRRLARGVWRPSVVISDPKRGKEVMRPAVGPNRAQRRRKSA